MMKFSTMKVLVFVRLIVETLVLGACFAMCIYCWIKCALVPISQLSITTIAFMTFPLWIGIFIRGNKNGTNKE